MNKKYNIAVAGLLHETVTFWPGLTVRKEFAPEELFGEDVLIKSKNTNTCIGGFIDICELNQANLIPFCTANGGATQTVSDKTFEFYKNIILDGLLKSTIPIHGVLLDLHGAMVTQSSQNPETDLVEEVRKIVGKEIPIMVALDLHANKDQNLLKFSTAVFGYQSSPHIDMHQTGVRAAKALFSVLNGEIDPTIAFKKPGIVVPSVFSATTTSPGLDIIDRVKYWMEKPGVVDVTALFGFAWSDVNSIGMSMIAITNNDQNLADQIVEDLCQLAQSKKEELTGKKKNTLYNLAEAVNLAKNLSGNSSKPILLLDHADRSNDTTFVLSEVLKLNAKNVAIPCFYDPVSAETCIQVGAGNNAQLNIGAKTNWNDGGKLTLNVKILWAGQKKYKGTGPMEYNREIDLGATAIVDINGVWLQLVSKHMPLIDTDPFTQFGFDPADFKIIVSKSKTHFRAVYEKLAETIILVDAPGQCPADLSRFCYKNVAIPAYPINNL